MFLRQLLKPHSKELEQTLGLFIMSGRTIYSPTKITEVIDFET